MHVRLSQVFVCIGVALGMAQLTLAQSLNPPPPPPIVPNVVPTAQPGATTFVIEGEDFIRTERSSALPIKWGQNLYKANFANAFLSRQAALGMGTPGRGAPSGPWATATVIIPAAGEYRVLARYEAPYHFEYMFQVNISQNGKTFKKFYGRPGCIKLWPFGEGLKDEVVWEWGANENIVWEGHDFIVPLEPGPAVISVTNSSASAQCTAGVTIDCFLFTTDAAGLQARIEKETNLPLASWLTQTGEVWARVVNQSSTSALKVTFSDQVSPGPGEKREPLVLDVGPGETSQWVDAGALLPTFVDTRWPIQAASVKPEKGAAPAPEGYVEFGLPSAKGPVPGVRFDLKGPSLELVARPNIKAVGLADGIFPITRVLSDYLADLEKLQVPGKPPVKVPLTAISFPYRQGDAQYNQAVDRFNALLGLNHTASRGKAPDAAAPGGTIIPFGLSTSEKMKETLEAMKAKGQLQGVAGFMIGSETSNNLFPGPAKDDEGFREFLKSMGVLPAQVTGNEKSTWADVMYMRNRADKHLSTPEQIYFDALYDQELRLRETQRATDILRQFVPDALVAINFNSYMVDSERGAPCLGPTYAFAESLRRKALTLPWIQDYLFLMPMGWHGMQFLNVDLMRAGIRHYPRQAMAASIMPQSPGNNPRSWRRMFYGHMAHGINRFDLFQIVPLPVGNTRYHVSDTRMFREIRTVAYELGTFEDKLVGSKVAPAEVGFFFSRAGDISGCWQPPFATAKLAMYAGLKLANVPVDAVIEDDLYDGTLEKYKVLIICDPVVSLNAVKAISKWLDKGGLLVAGPFVGTDRPDAPILQLLRCAKGPHMLVTSNGVVNAAEVLKGAQTQPAGGGYPSLRFYQQDLVDIPAARIFSEYVPGAGGRLNGGGLGIYHSMVPLKAGTGAKAVAQFKGAAGASIVITQHPDQTYRTIAYGFAPGVQRISHPIPIGRSDANGSAHRTVTEILDPSIEELVRELRSFDIAMPRVKARTSAMVETAWIDSPAGILIPVIDWNNESDPREITLEFKLDNAESWTAADHAGRPVALNIQENNVTATIKIDGAGALALTRKQKRKAG